VKCAGVLLDPREFPCDFLKDLVYSMLMDTNDVLRERVENAATTVCNNRDMLKIVGLVSLAF
jgi:hypothetical protein